MLLLLALAVLARLLVVVLLEVVWEPLPAAVGAVVEQGRQLLWLPRQLLQRLVSCLSQAGHCLGQPPQ